MPSEGTLDRSLAELDPDAAAPVNAELARQRGTPEMIASENFPPLAVSQARGSVLTDKYAGDYPGRRYHGGCAHVDVIEQVAALSGAEDPLYPTPTGAI